nr:MAG TPA: hypothetical protein [Caudoviricetes sp.]
MFNFFFYSVESEAGRHLHRNSKCRSVAFGLFCLFLVYTFLLLDNVYFSRIN